ncbi:hypothetical protein HYC85_022684 [Camellia sinensis]|uniref:Uncharacterized protein n=1 Tax=Camellia sinensis TaxID=4442 RepID=A0A7J7GDN2_CAMSI|nr:hypothetical protein HYC85_022684 [Camellia sinensis]
MVEGRTLQKPTFTVRLLNFSICSLLPVYNENGSTLHDIFHVKIKRKAGYSKMKIERGKGK